MTTFRSTRADGRGHRPRGVRTHAEVRVAGMTPPRIVAAVVRRLDALGYGSRAEFCRRTGVPSKTLWRWTRGKDWPSADRCRQLLRWLDRTRVAP